MTVAEEIASDMGGTWLPRIYEEKVRSGRTRSYEFSLPNKENSAVIQHTLLGIELKVGKWRMACPDLSTARYLRVFARLGCEQIAVPYDISQIPGLADELESSWQRMLLLVDEKTRGRPEAARAQIRSRVIKAVREEVAKIGAGEKMPLFNTKTKQRR